MHINTSDGAQKAMAELRAARLAAVNAADPEEHPYIGDGTSGCMTCRSPMNAHITFNKARNNPCPQCGCEVHNYWSSNSRDPGDVDPRADCTNPLCDWGY